MIKTLPTKSRSISELKLSGIIKHFGKKRENGELNPLIRTVDGKRIAIFGMDYVAFHEGKNNYESSGQKFVIFDNSPELLEILSTKNYGDSIRIKAVLNRGTGWRAGKFNRTPEWEVLEITYGSQKTMPKEVLNKMRERKEKEALEKKGIDYEALRF